ncbi:MAG TPA: sulfite exporter TauE/SafE family protein [Burkholderiaceae bacterium]|nr:sulfite exporter TauE/SafE family protein [Burkholderiaceae bacterium]
MLDLLTTQAIAAFMLALLGGLHCAGMCGGFVGALQLHRPRDVPATRLAAGYHTGRITSYTLAGALVGALGGALYAVDLLPVQLVLLVVGSLMLFGIGASLFGRAAWLKRLEPMGLGLWRLVGPLARRTYPPRSGRQALLAGLAWGWIPCGMVYAALPLALLAGGPWQGALVMLAFGLGTLPNMIAIDVAVTRFGRSSRAEVSGTSVLRTWARPFAGAVVVLFGLSGLAHAARIVGAGHPTIEALASICHPGAAR